VGKPGADESDPFARHAVAFEQAADPRGMHQNAVERPDRVAPRVDEQVGGGARAQGAVQGRVASTDRSPRPSRHDVRQPGGRSRRSQPAGGAALAIDPPVARLLAPEQERALGAALAGAVVGHHQPRAMLARRMQVQPIGARRKVVEVDDVGRKARQQLGEAGNRLGQAGVGCLSAVRPHDRRQDDHRHAVVLVLAGSGIEARIVVDDDPRVLPQLAQLANQRGGVDLLAAGHPWQRGDGEMERARRRHHARPTRLRNWGTMTRAL
jgi:hypothetical protein